MKYIVGVAGLRIMAPGMMILRGCTDEIQQQ
jgi:hypothetical protein